MIKYIDSKGDLEINFNLVNEYNSQLLSMDNQSS